MRTKILLTHSLSHWDSPHTGLREMWEHNWPTSTFPPLSASFLSKWVPTIFFQVVQLPLFPFPKPKWRLKRSWFEPHFDVHMVFVQEWVSQAESAVSNEGSQVVPQSPVMCRLLDQSCHADPPSLQSLMRWWLALLLLLLHVLLSSLHPSLACIGALQSRTITQLVPCEPSFEQHRWTSEAIKTNPKKNENGILLNFKCHTHTQTRMRAYSVSTPNRLDSKQCWVQSILKWESNCKKNSNVNCLGCCTRL